MSVIQTIVSRYGGWLASDKKSGAIPAPGHSRRDRSVSLRLNQDGKLLIHCFSDTDWREVKADLIRDGAASVHDFIGSSHNSRSTPTRRRSPNPQRKCSVSFEHARKAWDTRVRIHKTVGASYLERRGLRDLVSSPSIGFHNRLALSPRRLSPSAPCLMAKITNRQGAFAGVQATFLFQARHQVRKRRLVFGQQKGFSIKLEQPTDLLLVGEGLESTASAARRFGMPGWALLNTGNLAAFVAPASVRSLIIACDNDAPGWRAAKACMELNQIRGVACKIRAPKEQGADWNDLDKRSK